MATYTKPICPKDSLLVKSRCECKKSSIITRKNVKGKRNYQEQWAIKPGMYSLRIPSEAQLKVRQKRIDEVYETYIKIKKLDKSFLHPKNWQYPPEYCYNHQLINVLKDIKADLKGLETSHKS